MIKYRLAVWGTTVIFQIAEMDESQRGEEAPFAEFAASNEFMVCAGTRPEIMGDTVWLRGADKELDNVIAQLDFPTGADAKAYAAKVRVALDEWIFNGGFEERKPKMGRWKPEHAEQYWFRLAKGVPHTDRWADTARDEGCYAIGNVYKTQEEAEAASEKQKAIVRVNDAIDIANEGWVPDWSNLDEAKYGICYYHKEREFRTCDHYNVQRDNTFACCKSDEVANKIIAAHEADLKIIFGVEK